LVHRFDRHPFSRTRGLYAASMAAADMDDEAKPRTRPRRWSNWDEFRRAMMRGLSRSEDDAMFGRDIYKVGFFLLTWKV